MHRPSSATCRAMQKFARIVLGYHGCLEPLATELLTDQRAIADWPQSANRWDWLGRGIYFWEHSPGRAFEWAREKAAQKGRQDTEARVIGAVIQLGRCFDLTDLAYTRKLTEAYAQIEDDYRRKSEALPANRGPGGAAPIRELDCLVINYLLDALSEQKIDFQTVRGPFWEGDDAFPGSKIREQSHVQIAVRDPSCILGVFRPNLG